jgi:hypothetical protein
MKKPHPSTWTDRSPIPSTKHIPKPGFPIRSGVGATATAILIFVALFCIFQYWLLTATLEAYHSGDKTLPLGAFFVSVGCFIMATALVIIGEVAMLKQQDYLRGNEVSKDYLSRDAASRANLNKTDPADPEDRNPFKGHPAGGGDAG